MLIDTSIHTLPSNLDAESGSRQPSPGAQVFVMILAGYETTANALAFAVYLLTANPAKRDRLLAELDAYGRTRTPTLRELDRCARY